MRVENDYRSLDIYKKKLDIMDAMLHQISRMNMAENEEKLNLVIPALLQTMGEYTEADRVYIFDWESEQKNSMSNTFEWCADEVEPEIENLQDIPISGMPSWMERFERHETIVIHDLESVREMEPQEYEFLKMQNIQSLIAVPIYTNSTLQGFIGLDNPETHQENMLITMLSDIGGHLGCLRENMKATKKLEEAVAEADRANQAKTDFLRRISHDVRTPLNGIRGMLEIGNYYAQDLEKQKECRKKIETATDHLLSLVNDVLDMNKLESGKFSMKYEPFRLRQVLDEVNTVSEVQANEHDIRFICKDTGDVEHDRLIGNPVYLKRILLNFTSNAIKYNRPGGKVEVLGHEIFSDGKKVTYEFIIQDTGIGMSQEFLNRAFEPFAQEERSTANTNYSGTGLGLGIAKQLIDFLGGTLKLTSTEGEGTTVTFTLPFQIDCSEETVKELNSYSDLNLEGIRVLLAEDNDLNAEIARFMLEKHGIAVTWVQNGEMAVDTFSEKPDKYNLILMDVMMPIMDGLTAASQIRSLDYGKQIPICAMTANAFTDDIQKSQDAGMNLHLTKPLQEEELIKSIYELIMQSEHR